MHITNALKINRKTIVKDITAGLTAAVAWPATEVRNKIRAVGIVSEEKTEE